VTATKLARCLRGLDSPSAGPISAFRLARQAMLAGQRIDMKDLAAELGVDRATLFRWVGNRDQLLAEVIWSTAEPTWRRAVERAPGAGPDRVVAAFDRFVREVIAAEFFGAYLRREPERALRLLTTKASGFQHRLVAEFERLLRHEQETRKMRLPLPAQDLAYLMVRIAESFIYSDLITGETPDATKATDAIRVLLDGTG
jgi:AcrR family transcriptional regulator